MPDAPSRTRLAPEVRRRQILETAERLFVSHGFEAVDMAAIAEKVGIARPTVYKYFPSTEAILERLLQDALPPFEARLTPLLPHPADGADPQDVKALFRFLLGERRLLALLHSGGGPIFLHHQRAFLSELLTKVLRPRLGPERVPYLLLSLCVLLESMAFWAIRDPAIDSEQLADTLAAFSVSGLALFYPRP